jgi:hypothetical protein
MAFHQSSFFPENNIFAEETGGDIEGPVFSSDPSFSHFFGVEIPVSILESSRKQMAMFMINDMELDQMRSIFLNKWKVQITEEQVERLTCIITDLRKKKHHRRAWVFKFIENLKKNVFSEEIITRILYFFLPFQRMKAFMNKTENCGRKRKFDHESQSGGSWSVFSGMSMLSDAAADILTNIKSLPPSAFLPDDSASVSVVPMATAVPVSVPESESTSIDPHAIFETVDSKYFEEFVKLQVLILNMSSFNKRGLLKNSTLEYATRYLKVLQEVQDLLYENCANMTDCYTVTKNLIVAYHYAIVTIGNSIEPTVLERMKIIKRDLVDTLNLVMVPNSVFRNLMGVFSRCKDNLT